MNALEEIERNMVAIAGGEMLMGSEAYARENPVHKIVVADFELSKYQVTQGQWLAVMGENPSHCQEDLRLPVEQISWDDAMAFVFKLNELTGKKYRLPRENEWEFAARGGNLSKNFKHVGSDNLAEVAWFNGNSEFKTHVVGTKLPNELGIYDMNGNVWEWCADRVPKAYEEPDRIPTWEEDANSKNRILRGGSYINYAVFVRPTYRWIDRPDSVENYVGMRLGR